MGEARRKRALALRDGGAGAEEPVVVDTLGGRMHVRWDEAAPATPNGQLVFFAEFLATTGVFERWVQECPLEYRSGNAPSKRDVLGTLLLGVLAGHRRYAHITALRGDAVAAQALGMNKVVSEDALRRGLERISEDASAAWMRSALLHSVQEALDKPWVLDIDASIKPLYGRQEGAELGYNPHKPGRPSHVLHTYWVGNLRLVLDVLVTSGKQHTSVHAKGRLGCLLDELGARRPVLVRGDCGYGNEGILTELESRKQPYLLRLRQTKNVQRLVARQFARSDWSRPDSQGCQMVEDELQLLGWSRKRRVVIVRQRIRQGLVRERVNDRGQLRLAFADAAVLGPDKLWEYTVLVTAVAYPIESIAALYRDRADCEVAQSCCLRKSQCQARGCARSARSLASSASSAWMSHRRWAVWSTRRLRNQPRRNQLYRVGWGMAKRCESSAMVHSSSIRSSMVSRSQQREFRTPWATSSVCTMRALKVSRRLGGRQPSALSRLAMVASVSFSACSAATRSSN
jgi:hypothetical protein